MSTVLAIIALWGLLVFFNWAMLKVGADFDEAQERLWKELKAKEDINHEKDINRDATLDDNSDIRKSGV